MDIKGEWRVAETIGGHLMIVYTHPSIKIADQAACPTGNDIEDLRKCLTDMLAATEKPVIKRKQLR